MPWDCLGLQSDFSCFPRHENYCKMRKQQFSLFVYRKREVFFLLKSENFLIIYKQKPGTFGKSLRNHKTCVCISVLLEYYTENN